MKGLRKVFFDTWGWLAIAHRDDQHHEEVAAFYRDFLIAGGVAVTTDYILDEAITLLRSRTTPKGTETLIDGIFAATHSGRMLVERVTEERWSAAWKLSRKFSDKGDISFTDFTSFVIMKELKIAEALTADHHYEFVRVRKLF